MGNASQVCRRPLDHLIRNIDAVNLTESLRHGPEQPSRTAADFERPPCSPVCIRRKTAQFPVKTLHHLRRGCEELFRILIAASERYIEVGVFTRTLIPVALHALGYCGIYGLH